MSTDSASAVDAGPAPVPAVDAAGDQIECAKPPAPAFLHSPPDSNNAAKSDASDSELSDLDDEPVLDDPPPLPGPGPVPAVAPDGDDDIGDVLPDHWSGSVPVFRPTMHQFSDFQRFMKKVDCYGMKSGIIKIIPPDEWKDAQPQLDELVKHIRVREPIKQDIMGSNGTYRQVNILHGRSYNLPQWRQLCEQSEHQPPARRGERRANADKPKPPRSRPAAPKATKPSTPRKRGKARPARGKAKQAQDEQEDRPMTPVSPKPEPDDAPDDPVDSIERNPGDDADDAGQPSVGRMGGSRQAKPKTQSVSARRKYSRREGSAMVDEAAFKDFDYRMDIAEYTPERCEELERVYWKTLTYAPPLYGADMMGTLFDDRTDIWNLNKLPNLLDVLGTKVPGVNTAYLYLGMWKATFAWHLEDVDLYSINYLHFGAPKQWYSISQADARRFEAAMKNIWPADAKACDQFLRHKGFLISPHHLLTHYGIKVNKVVSYPGEFVVTYPYGYHSGYNLGYNCAEAVNFALDSWLEMGKIAKKCECAQAQDSVWINVYEIERKLRGEETEYEETEDEEDEDEDEDMSGLPTPPASHGVRLKDAAGRKRKRGRSAKGDKVKVKKIKLRLKARVDSPCCLCPHDMGELDMLPTDDGRKAHRLCALYVPETYIDVVDDRQVVCNVSGIGKDRLDLKCLFCRSKRGACFQCCHKKCARAYHATCAAAAGVFVEDQDVPVFGEDGTEFKEQAFEFSCRFHRAKRDKKHDGSTLETDSGVLAAAQALRKGEIRQFQYYKGEIFAGFVVENRADEQTVLIDVIPNGDRIEVEWKWLLLPDPSDFRLPKASAKAIPMPASRKAQQQLNAKRLHDDKPRKDDMFAEGYTWAEFQVEPVSNKDQAKVDLAKPDQVWHYLGKTSTEARAQYTEDLAKQRHNPRGNFLDTLPKPPRPVSALKPAVFGHGHGAAGSYAGPYANPGALPAAGVVRPEKPYVYKPRKPIDPRPNGQLMYTPQRFSPAVSPATSSSLPPAAQQSYYSPNFAYPNNGQRATTRFEPPLAPSPPVRPPMPAAAQHYGGPPNVQRPAQLAANCQRPTASPYAKAGAAQSRPTWQVHSSVYQKYPFFQVNHNRDSSKYRTPYGPWGGFTNGYEGNLRAHLISTQSDLLRRSGLNPISPMAAGQAYRPPNPPDAAQLRRSGPSPPTPQTWMPAGPRQQQDASMSRPPVSETEGRPLHPAIRPQYGLVQQQGPAMQQGQAMQQAPVPAVKTKAVPVPKPYKVGLPAAVSIAPRPLKAAMQGPSKQSPVPLPANYLAAMSSAPASTAGQPETLVAGEPTKAGLSTAQHAQPGVPFGAGPAVDAASIPASRPPGMAPPPAMLQNIAPKADVQSLAATAAAAGLAPAREVGSGQKAAVQTAGAQEQCGAPAGPAQQEFPDVPGCESMEFVERMMENLKRASQRNGAVQGGD